MSLSSQRPWDFMEAISNGYYRGHPDGVSIIHFHEIATKGFAEYVED